MIDTTKLLSSIRSLMTPPTTREKLAQAAPMCRQLISKDPNHAEAYYLLGILTVELDGEAQAIPHLIKSVKLQPQSAENQLLLARCLSATGQWEAAVPHAQTGLSLQSKNGGLDLNMGNVEALSTLGRHALYTGEWATATSYFTGIINFLQAHVSATQGHIQPFDPSELPPVKDRAAYPILYLPVEVKAREFESKCLLALAAAEIGFHVVIGRTWVLTSGSFSDLPPGIILFKTLSGRDARNMATAQLNGHHLIAALDEESFGRSSEARAVKLNVDPLAVEVADLSMVQGQAHKETWASLFNIDAAQLVVTGNPKSDLLRQQNTTETQDKIVRPRILFCTMSGNINPKGRGFARTMEQALVAATNRSTPEMMLELGNLLRDASQFETAMIPQLENTVRTVASKFSDADIIVRPHPVEDPALWLNRFNDLKNVRVEAGGALTEWLNQCDVMVYLSGCATGVEARLHDVPAVHLAGDGTAPDPGFGLSSMLNAPVCSASDVVERIEALLSGDIDEVGIENTDQYIWSGNGELISRIVASALLELLNQHRRDGPVPVNTLRSLHTNRSETFKLSDFHMQKFPDTSTEEVSDLLAHLADKFGISKPENVEDLGEGLFLVGPTAEPF